MVTWGGASSIEILYPAWGFDSFFDVVLWIECVVGYDVPVFVLQVVLKGEQESDWLVFCFCDV